MRSVILIVVAVSILGLAAAWLFRRADPASEYLGLPNVGKAESLVRSSSPEVRIVHLRDFHVVPEDAFRADMEQDFGRKIDDKELGLLYAEHIAYVRTVQAQLEPMLAALLVRHNLKKVFVEGVATDETDNLRSLVQAIRDAEKNERPILERHLANSIAEKNESRANGVRDLIAILDRQYLELGAAGRLAMEGGVDLLPLEDPGVFRAANPFQGGAMKLNAGKWKAREDGQVKTILASGESVAIVILGGSHDLSESVRRLGSGKVDYVRLSPKAYLK